MADVLSNIGLQGVRTNQNLNPADSATQVFKISNETLIIEEGPTVVKQQNLYNGVNDSFILGHSLNGKMGVANGVGGTQILLGDYRSASTFKSVSSPNNIFHEHFRYNTFLSTGTATWDTTTDFRVEFTGLQTTTTKSVYLDSTASPLEVTRFKVNYTSTGNIKCEVSCNAGTNWLVVDKNVDYYTFVSGGYFDAGVFDSLLFDQLPSGSNMLLRFTEQANTTGTVSELEVDYDIG